MLAASVSRRSDGRLPDPLKRGIERLSGVAMDDVRVHYDSARPAALGADAFAQGRDIHVAPGQERHLPHEAWHVVQQLAGRVAPTGRVAGTAVNENARLEREADDMGARALQSGPAPAVLREPAAAPAGVAQLNRTVERIMSRNAAQITQTLNGVPPAHRPQLAEKIVAYFEQLSGRELDRTPRDRVEAIAAILSSAQRSAVFARILHPPPDPAAKELVEFARQWNYRISPRPFVHELFGHHAITLYPIEKTDREREVDRGKGMASIVHRPILDVERVGGTYYARCYLGLFAKATEAKHKDITATAEGKIVFHHIMLMNIGNPFKALLWCEDYLVSSEHGWEGASPVVRSFLIPLAEASDVFSGKHHAFPVDQNRGSGQFKSAGVSAFEGHLHPLQGSLVSFFHDKDLADITEANQTKHPLSRLQSFVTGVTSEAPPQQLAKEGIAAQHGRQGLVADWSDAYETPMEAYYHSVGRDLAWQVRDLRERLKTARGTERGKLSLRLKALEKKLGIKANEPTIDPIELGFNEPLAQEKARTARR